MSYEAGKRVPYISSSDVKVVLKRNSFTFGYMK